MDSVSHACFSYLVCRSSGTAPSPRIGLLAATVGVLPDLDFLVIPFLSDLSSFAFHRGPSHSLFMALIMGLLLGGLLFRWLGLSWIRSSLIVGLAWVSHIVLDMCTGFGVALWWPLTHARSSVDLLFVVDLLASLPLVTALIWDIRSNWKKTNPPRRTALAGLIVWGLYALTAFGVRSEVTREFRTELNRQGYKVSQIHSEPTPFNNQLWYLCAKTENGFVITYRSIWDGQRWERWLELPRLQEPLSTFAGEHPLTNKMEVVLEDWYTCTARGENRLNVIDLRLGKRYGWEDDDAPFLFIHHLWKAEPGVLNWSLNKPASRYDFGRLKGLFIRVFGHIPEHRLKSNSGLEQVYP